MTGAAPGSLAFSGEPSTCGPTESAFLPQPNDTTRIIGATMIATNPPATDGLVRPQIPRPLSMRLAAAEYDRMAETLAGLSPDDWSRPTACTAWDVRQLGCHMV